MWWRAEKWRRTSTLCLGPVLLRLPHRLVGLAGDRGKWLRVCYDGHPQALVEKALVIAAVGSIPVMLLVKPFYLRYKHRQKLQVLF